mmetsp:Transcript_22305/g.63673  ORF Transcript_22305/g.63673 Transcript_22305/m.63673 type:complete len:116 (-) Transcript_22305:390-737(-)
MLDPDASLPSRFSLRLISVYTTVASRNHHHHICLSACAMMLHCNMMSCDVSRTHWMKNSIHTHQAIHTRSAMSPPHHLIWPWKCLPRNRPFLSCLPKPLHRLCLGRPQSVHWDPR